MDDIIAMGYDAKHSFEDKIQPIEEAYEAYHNPSPCWAGWT